MSNHVQSMTIPPLPMACEPRPPRLRVFLVWMSSSSTNWMPEIDITVWPKFCPKMEEEIIGFRDDWDLIQLVKWLVEVLVSA